MRKCVYCDETQIVYRVTELTDGKVSETYDMCLVCGKEYMKDVYKDLQVEKEDNVNALDATEITTPEQLLNFIGKLNMKSKIPQKTPCVCGMTDKEFHANGKFGCANCYEHFKEEFDTLVVPYQKADEHIGKRPKHRLQREETPEEHVKTVRLRLAKASEIEDYETAAILKKELDSLITSIPSPEQTSEGQ